MTHEDYARFLDRKRIVVSSTGIEVSGDDFPAGMFPWQRDVTRWALRKGRAALFASTGLGKTLMSLAWAQHAAERALILAPLAVAQQTVREGEKWGIPVTYCRAQADAPASGITITNYELVDRFDASTFGAIVLDESSILKAHDGKTRTRLIEQFSRTPMRLCCTATPAPNDIAELANHAEFLGILSRVEMLAAFFVHDDEGWRLKGHARDPFYRWLASWGLSLNLPSDIGYPDDGYILPPLSIEPIIIPVDYTPPDQLFFTGLKGITDRTNVRKSTLAARVEAAAALINDDPAEPWLAWVGLNDEGRELAKLVPDAVLVEGNQKPADKEAAMLGFLDGKHRVMISKTSIAGFGLNMQHVARMVFVGLNDSYESYFQAIRRCWRFGQTRPVTAYIVLSSPEEPIFQNVLRKEREAHDLARELVKHVAAFEAQEIAQLGARDDYAPVVPLRVPAWIGA